MTLTTLKVTLADIETVTVDEKTLFGLIDEQDFVSLSLDLLIEAGSYVCIAANIFPSGEESWTRDEAIVGGFFVRLYKNISGILDQTCQHRRETSTVFIRLAFESIVNLQFLLKNSSPDLFNSYVHYSLQHEKRLLAIINRKIEERNGQELPIETRMRRSIERMLKTAGAKGDTAQDTKIQNWGNKNLYEKAEEVGLGEFYRGIFGGISHAVHGNWPDLLEYHLLSDDDQFTPQLDWRRPRPQPLNAITLLSAFLIKDYFAYLGLSLETIDGFNQLDSLVIRTRRAADAHENLLRSSIE